MPAVHPHASGAVGTGHGCDYYIQDKELACVRPAQCLAVAADMLLTDGAALAKKVLAHETDGALKEFSDLLNI